MAKYRIKPLKTDFEYVVQERILFFWRTIPKSSVMDYKAAVLCLIWLEIYNGILPRTDS